MDKIEVTQSDQLLVADVLDEVSSLLDHNGIGQIADLIRDGEYDGHECVQIAARHRTTRTDATPVAEAWAGMEAAMQDPDYAWGWHCNLAMPIMDATGITHEQANMAAAHLMQHLWKCDITTHPHYQYEKSGAQSYAEFRIEADKAEDAVLPDATHPPATDVMMQAKIDRLADLLAKACGDIAALLVFGNREGDIRSWTAEYAEALNEHDAALKDRTHG